MEASNLMATDLVTHQGRIVCITALDVGIKKVRGIYIDNGDDTGWFNEEFADPIPLTEEVLMMNGWEKSDPNWPSTLRRYYKQGEREWSFSVWRNKGVWDMYIHAGGDMQINKFHPLFFHEVQHALHLCELYELVCTFIFKD